jgi:subtilisin family serine protease
MLCAIGAGSLAQAQTALKVPIKDQTAALQTAPAPAALPGYAELAKKAQTESVMVIFALNAGALGAAENALAPASFEADPAQITAGQDRLVKALELAKAEAVKPVWGLPLVAAQVNAEQLAALAGSGLVAAIHENRLSTPILARTVPHIGTPNLRAVGLRGQGQIVAVLDTGIQSQHDFFYDQTTLRSRVVREACFSSIVSFRSNSVCPGYIPFREGPGATTPCWVITACYHGSHVAGIAAGRANPTASYDGVAPDASILSVQVFSLFGTSAINAYLSAYDSDILSGLSYVRTRRLAGDKIAAVNMSIGGGFVTGPCNSSPFETIIAILKRLDVATVIASGNDGMSTGVSDMACPPSAVVVGSSSLSDRVSTFSNSAALVDLLAPGEAVSSSSSRTASSYMTISGTSMAAPHVAGAFALLRQQFPCTPIGVIENALKVSGVNVAHPSNGQVYKRINLAGALHHLRFVEQQYRCPVVKDPVVASPQVITKE